MTTDLRPLNHADLPALLALNNAHSTETGPLDLARLAQMAAMAFHARTNSACTVFLVAFDQSADYDSVNFLWFRDRYRRFVYIDRVIVSAALRGRGIARALYDDLFNAALAAGHDTIVAEVNSLPPNPGSDAFHAALGFVEAGQGSPMPGKRVRYLVKSLP